MRTRNNSVGLWAFVGLLLGLTVSCSPQDQITVLEPPVYLDQVVEIRTLPVSDTYDYFREYGDVLVKALDFAKRTDSIDLASINYRTVDPKGQPVICSGLVAFPKGRIRGVVEMSFHAHAGHSSGASDLFITDEMAPVLLGYVTLIPDLVGKGLHSGTTHLIRPVCFLENNGRVAYDFRKAAEEFLLRQYGYVMPKKTLMTGFSLGATSALSAAKYYQEHDPAIQIDRLIIGGGAYDLETAFQHYALSDMSEYIFLTQAVMAFDYWYDLHLDYSQVFCGKLLENDWYKQFENGGNPTEDIHEYLGPHPSAYMHPDFFKPIEEQNAEFQKLHAVMAQQSHLEGWVPKAPIYLFHGTQDDCVPYACGLQARDVFKKAGARVSFFSADLGHTDMGVNWYIDLMIYLAAR